jgi:histidinol-phosphate/aromatic aminotransferase/cobyric acid decarboxylase-like protein
VASHYRAATRYHGDQAAVPGMLDFAVDVRASEPPSWLVSRLSARFAVPKEADLAGVGNPANPTSVLRSLTKTRSLAGPMRRLRPAMVAGLTNIGLDVINGRAPVVLFTVPGAHLMRKHLDSKGIAGRPRWPVLVDVVAERLR